MRAVAFLALASSLSLALAQATSPPAASTPPAPSSASPGATSTYHNDALHLSYSYPTGYTDASAMVGPAFEATLGNEANPGAKDATRCVTLPFSIMNNSGGQFAMVLLVRADAGCMKKTFTAEQLPDVARGEVQGLAQSGARTQFAEPIAFTTAGHMGELLRGTFQMPTGQTLHAMVACVLLKPDVGCWQFLASSDDALRAMSAFPVSFEGSQPEPLVPPATLPKP